MFTSGKGLTEQGLYKTDMLTAVAEQTMLEQVSKLVVVVDSSKVGERTGMLFSTPSQIDIVITGKNADKTVVSTLREKGVEVLLV
jgi:DeoR family ulaG and ulaABCDEF operon transcriptional repressor